jgi:ligand-binding SRPBCC domain-containing protein
LYRNHPKPFFLRIVKVKDMKIYTLKRVQALPITLPDAWAFLSNPANLATITPASMQFAILRYSGDGKMYAGQIIQYRVRVLPLLTVGWTTEITHVNAPWHFVDEQRFGPYAFWHHQHWLREVSDGVEVTDEVNYAIGWGHLGNLANQLFVDRRLNAIFDHRFNALQQLFGLEGH